MDIDFDAPRDHQHEFSPRSAGPATFDNIVVHSSPSRQGRATRSQKHLGATPTVIRETYIPHPSRMSKNKEYSQVEWYHSPVPCPTCVTREEEVCWIRDKETRCRACVKGSHKCAFAKGGIMAFLTDTGAARAQRNHHGSERNGGTVPNSSESRSPDTARPTAGNISSSNNSRRRDTSGISGSDISRVAPVARSNGVDPDAQLQNQLLECEEIVKEYRRMLLHSKDALSYSERVYQPFTTMQAFKAIDVEDQMKETIRENSEVAISKNKWVVEDLERILKREEEKLEGLRKAINIPKSRFNQ
ncbi:hypothetical protein SISNIDRAFT_490272 [Sistotremastrum niveocremeum HHB9708]|uniref:Uncharacterized protein n=1 Tax=Sistotremastrum niveocremeum HHB9708 TaxID=1314777 RepID=A0A164P1D4_9AGAM|nr:hypothetical protein SISNIDRAFT_490272 [Sistotremastrum niveocremeum HHB9708]